MKYNMVVVFGKTVDEIEEAIDLSLVWTFRVEGDRIKFLKDDDTWTKPNLKDIGTPQEVMKYIAYAIANEAKICSITTDVMKSFREKFDEQRKYEKQQEMRRVFARARAKELSKED
jgi:hypothetical protein